MHGRGIFPYPSHPLTPYAPLIVNAALTGMVARREQVPHLPVTGEQIVADAERCVAAGATVLHLHARDAGERPDWRRAAYAETVAEIRRRLPEVVVCLTTSGREIADVDRRADVLALTGAAKPDMASLTLGSLNFHGGPSVNAIATVEELARRMRDAGVTPELELFDLGMAHLLHRLLERGLLEPPLYVNLMLGFPNSAPADARSLVALLGALPPDTVWAAGGLGAYQRPANALAAAAGGHVRTGLEDNPYLDDVARTPAANDQLVARAAALADAVGRPLATAAQTRALLGLPGAAAAPVASPTAVAR